MGRSLFIWLTFAIVGVYGQDKSPRPQGGGRSFQDARKTATQQALAANPNLVSTQQYYNPFPVVNQIAADRQRANMFTGEPTNFVSNAFQPPFPIQTPSMNMNPNSQLTFPSLMPQQPQFNFGAPLMNSALPGMSPQAQMNQQNNAQPRQWLPAMAGPTPLGVGGFASAGPNYALGMAGLSDPTPGFGATGSIGVGVGLGGLNTGFQMNFPGQQGNLFGGNNPFGTNNLFGGSGVGGNLFGTSGLFGGQPQIPNIGLGGMITDQQRPCYCTAEYWPVCGTDGKDYTNLCMLECVARNNQSLNLVVAYRGKCVATASGDVGWNTYQSQFHVPSDTCAWRCYGGERSICDLNGVRYRNECHYWQAQCKAMKSGGQMSGIAPMCSDGTGTTAAPGMGGIVLRSSDTNTNFDTSSLLNRLK